jgi:hypothetical protein
MESSIKRYDGLTPKSHEVVGVTQEPRIVKFLGCIHELRCASNSGTSHVLERESCHNSN